MTEPVDFAVALARLEGKVDTLTVKVDAGDSKNNALVQIVRESLDELKQSFQNESEKSGAAIEQVRSDLSPRIERLEAWNNRLVGGLALASALGVSGLVALIRGWGG